MKVDLGAPRYSSARSVRASMLLVAGGVFLCSLALLLRSVPSAQALPEGPQVTGGSQPYVSFSGSYAGGDDLALYTVPADRVFVLTAACVSTNLANLLENGAIKVEGSSNVMYCTANTAIPGGFLTKGQGHVTFAPGSSIALAASSTVHYTVQGYLARP